MRGLRAVLLFAAATLVLTWPLPRRIHIVEAGDVAFFAWEMAWEMHALLTSPAELPHPNIFHPLPYVLGMDEPILGTTILVLPFRLLTGDTILLFNVARLLTFFISAVGAYFLARELRCSGAAAVLGGLLFAFSPIRMELLGHVSVLSTQWLPPTLLFLIRFARSARLLDGAAAAVFFVLATYACGYHAILGVVVFSAASVPLLIGRWDRWRGVALALALVAIGTAPLYWLHQAALAPLGYTRNAGETQLYSAGLESFLAASSWNWLYGAVTERFRTHSYNLFPGLMPVVLAAAGATSLVRARQWPSREAWALFGMATSAGLVALGPEVRWFDRTLFAGPFGWLRDHVSVFSMIRVPSRSSVFVALGLSMLAAIGLDRLRLRGFGVAAILLFGVAETVAIPLRTTSALDIADDRRAPAPVSRWLAAQPGDFAILELPIRGVETVFEHPRYHDTAYMIESRHHWKRLVNGSSGVEPAAHSRLRAAAQVFPAPHSLEALAAVNVRYVVVHRAGLRRGERKRMDLALGDAPVRLVAEFGDDAVYELGKPEPGS